MNNQTTFALKILLPLSVLVCRSPRNRTGRNRAFQKTQTKGFRGSTPRNPRNGRLENRLDVVPRPYRPFMTASQLRPRRTRNRIRAENTVNYRRWLTSKTLMLPCVLLRILNRPLLPPVHRDRIPPNQSCIPHTILGIKGTIFLRVTRLYPRR